MFDPLARIIAYPDISSEELEDLRRAITADPHLAALVACREEIVASIHADISFGQTAEDRRLFALYSLFRAGRAGDLTLEEADLVAEHTDRFDRALAHHPGLAIASSDMADAAEAFSDLWDVHFEGDAAASEDDVERFDRAEDRSSVRHAPSEESRPLSRRRPAGARRSAGPSRRGGAYRWAVRTAIAVSVVAFAFVLTQVLERDSGMITVETAEGETRLVELAEGSTIRLLEASTLSYADPQSTLMRRAELSGRALFEIAPADRGFIIETSTARVTVLGTTFGVEAREGLTEVVLADGRLTLARNDKLDDLVILEPGQMSRVVAGSGPTPPVTVDVSRRLTWTGLFIFQSTPLAEIAAHLSEHFEVTIEVAPDLAGERVTGTFDQEQALREILDVIATAIGATVRSDAAGGYVLTHP